MRTIVEYELTQEEITEVEFQVRYISDRQDRPTFVKGGVKYEESYAEPFRRLDMFWINCNLDGTYLGALVVEPNIGRPENYSIHKNHCKATPISEIIKRATEWFKGTPEYLEQVEWTKTLAAKIAEDYANNFQTRPVK